MHDIEKLEKEWRIYKLKQLKPVAITAAIIGAGYLFFIGSTTLVSYSLVLTRPAIEIMSKKRNHIEQKEIEQHKETVSHSTIEVTKKEVYQKPIEEAEQSTTPEEPKEIVDSEPEEEKIDTLILKPDTSFLAAFSKAMSTNRQDSKVSLKKEVLHHPNPVPRAQKIASSPSTTQHLNISKSLVIQTKTSHNTLEHLIQRFNNKILYPTFYAITK